MELRWPENGAVLLIASEGAPAYQHAKKILSDKSPRSSALFDSRTHPDFYHLHPEKDSRWIKIDQVRELIEWSQGRPQISAKKVAIVSPAHAMNLQAANALLKTLEESSQETLFILITDKPSFIAETIRSRCFWIRTKEIIQESLAEVISNDLKDKIKKDLNTLKAKKTNAIAVAMAWIKEDPKELLNQLFLVINDEVKKSAADNALSKNPRPWHFLDNVIQAKRSLEEPNSPNVQLLLESLLIEYDL